MAATAQKGLTSGERRALMEAFAGKGTNRRNLQTRRFCCHTRAGKEGATGAVLHEGNAYMSVDGANRYMCARQQPLQHGAIHRGNELFGNGHAALDTLWSNRRILRSDSRDASR